MIKSGFWLNVKVGRTNITRANVTKMVFTCYRQSLHLYHFFPITDAPEKYKGPTKLHMTNFLKTAISSVLGTGLTFQRNIGNATTFPYL